MKYKLAVVHWFDTDKCTWDNCYVGPLETHEGHFTWLGGWSPMRDMNHVKELLAYTGDIVTHEKLSNFEDIGVAFPLEFLL